MKYLLVTGVSGGGKSQAVKFLEDLGYFCMDNIPPLLLPKIQQLFETSETSIQKVAFVIDIRNREFFSEFEHTIDFMKKDINNDFSVLFLDCSDEVILNRYKENKRRHPLAGAKVSNHNAIKMEREWLDAVKKMADCVIDTSFYSIWDLKKEIYEIFGNDRKEKGIKVEIMSFGFKHGIPSSCDYVFDVRFIPNPYYVPELRVKTGMDAEVHDYVMQSDEAGIFLDKLFDMTKFLLPYHEKEGKDVIVIGIGCTGGRHRSVAMTEELNKIISRLGYSSVVYHRDIHNDINHKTQP